MLKLISTDSSFFNDEPNFSILDGDLRRGLVKKAADSAVIDFASKLSPQEGRVYLHILAMGAGEYYGSNRNADYFPEDNLLEHFKTFETSPAHVFRNHVNKNPEIAIGQVVFAAYNHRMHRVELVAWVDKVRGKDIVERIERGEFPATSMACRTPFDVCAVCGNKARTRQEYCEHLSMELGRLYPDGKRAMALNSGPLRFFDISIVVRPADVTSAVLQKVAFVAPGECASGSAQEAEEAGLVEKSANHQKLSEFIKELDGEIVSMEDDLGPIMDKIQDPDRATIPALASFGLAEILDTFVHLGMSPSLGYLADLIGHRVSGTSGVGVGTLVEGYLKEHGLHKLPIADEAYAQTGPSLRVMEVLMPSVKQASVFPQYAVERAVGPSAIMGNTVFVPGTGYGYSGNGAQVEPTPHEVYSALMHRKAIDEGPGGLLKTLLSIGGAALAAKWYITQMIDRRMREIEESKQHSEKSGIKIVLVKSASDARLSAKLAKMSLLRYR
jgi:hypothetical protein